MCSWHRFGQFFLFSHSVSCKTLLRCSLNYRGALFANRKSSETPPTDQDGHILEGLGLDKSVWLHLISTSKIFMDCSMNKQTEEHKEFES